VNDKHKKYSVKISPAANDKMYLHFEFLSRISKDAAERLLEILVADIKSLERFPLRNPLYEPWPLKAGKYRYMLSAKRYRIVYQVLDNQIFVDDIQDCRRND
jgi:plasmid stabilization system protein ParE